MIQIENTLVSFDIFEKKFCCDLQQCKGICCVDGDSGAPLEKGEIRKIEKNYAAVKNFMTPAGIKAVEEQGFSVVDSEGDVVTPLVNQRECAYAIEEKGVCWCAIEKAWTLGKSDFRKPLSCHLYPIRITRYPEFEALNYNKWDYLRLCPFERRATGGASLSVSERSINSPLWRRLVRSVGICRPGDRIGTNRNSQALAKFLLRRGEDRQNMGFGRKKFCLPV